MSPARWGDIWLNESFATYAPVDVARADRSHAPWPDEADFARCRTVRRGDGDPTGSPAADQLFGYNSYDGGAIVLHALRLTIGDDAFFELLTTWAADNEGTLTDDEPTSSTWPKTVAAVSSTTCSTPGCSPIRRRSRRYPVGLA